MPAACWAREELERGAELPRLAHTCPWRVSRRLRVVSRMVSLLLCCGVAHTVYDLLKPTQRAARAAPRAWLKLGCAAAQRTPPNFQERTSPEGAAFPLDAHACAPKSFRSQFTLGYVRSTTRPQYGLYTLDAQDTTDTRDRRSSLRDRRHN